MTRLPSSPLSIRLLKPGRFCWVTMLACLLLVGPAYSALSDSPPPADRVFDDTRALEAPSRQIIAAELAELAADLKCDLWFTAVTFPADNLTLRQQSHFTRERWSPDRPAILLAYSRSDNAVSFSFSPVFWDIYPTATLVEITREATSRIQDNKLPLDERLVLAVQQFGQKIRELETARILQTQRFAPEEKHSLVTLAALLLGAAFVAALAGILSRRGDHAAEKEMHLPEVTVGLRLGAPFGGGHIAEIRTQPPSR